MGWNTIIPRNYKGEENNHTHMTRNGQFHVCCSYQVDFLSNEEYDTHIRKKDNARMAKNIAKDTATNEIIVLTNKDIF